MPENETERPSSYDRPLGDLLKELMNEASMLIRQETALARVEMTEKARMYMRASATLMAGAFLALFALGSLTACSILAIDLVLPGWLAALIIGVFYLIVVGVLIVVGMARLRHAGGPVPEQTIETIKEDVSWARKRARSATT